MKPRNFLPVKIVPAIEFAGNKNLSKIYTDRDALVDEAVAVIFYVALIVLYPPSWMPG